MAIAGGAKPAVTMQVQNGEIVVISTGMKQDVENNLEDAVNKLLKGEIVRVQNFGGLPTLVHDRLKEALAA